MSKAVGLYTQDKDAVTGLTKRQSQVLRLMNVEKKTQLQVSEELGVTRQRVRQIVEALMRKGFKIEKAKQPTEV